MYSVGWHIEMNIINGKYTQAHSRAHTLTLNINTTIEHTSIVKQQLPVLNRKRSRIKVEIRKKKNINFL